MKRAPKQTPNAEILNMSSILDAAIISVEIPLLVPYPFESRLSKVGTTTAGLTALWVQLPKIIQTRKFKGTSIEEESLKTPLKISND